MCMGRGRYWIDLLCDGISDAYICPAGVLASRPDMWREADTAGGCRWSAGISNLLAIHSAEEVIASTTTCKVPHYSVMKEQVRSATRPASLHIHLHISSDVFKPYKVVHTYIQYTSSISVFNDLWNMQGFWCETWIGNITAPGKRRTRGFYPAPWCWAGLPAEGPWLHYVYMCSLPIRNLPSLKSCECMQQQHAEITVSFLKRNLIIVFGKCKLLHLMCVGKERGVVSRCGGYSQGLFCATK